MSHRFLLIACTAAAVLSQSPAIADDDVKFAYKASELETMAGTKKLYGRLTDHSEAMCTYSGRRTLQDIRFEKDCEADLTNDLVIAIDHPRLYRVHEGEVGAVFIARRDD